MFGAFDMEEEIGQLATPADAMREYARNVGELPRYINCQWILTDNDVWVRNPHYRGPEQTHPDDIIYEDWK